MSNSQFGVRLYKEMASEKENFAISPLSVHSALGMLLLGAAGRTKQEMVRGMHIQSPIHPAFKVYSDMLDQGSGVNTTLMMANALYTKAGFNPKRRYLGKLRQFYDAELAEFDEDDPEGVINEWVKEKTMEKITEFLDDGEVTDDMAMMLINAVYFKGLWEDAFEEEQTSLETFTDKDMETHDVYFLRRTGHYPMHHSAQLGAAVLKMPYRGGRYSFNIILPDQGTNLDTVESRLSHDLLNETLTMLATQRPSRVMLQLPKFSMDTEQSMQSMLQALGIENVFQSSANFRKMSTNRNILVDKVKHRCIIEVDEQGTEAAATTGIGVFLTSMPMPFIVNRPFMFILRDDHSSVPLFMGRYANPQGDNMSS